MSNINTSYEKTQTPVSSGKDFHTARMKLWFRTIDNVVRFDRMNGLEPDPGLLPFVIRIAVELSDRTGTLGVRDDERVAWVARVFKVRPVAVRAAWISASSEAKAYRSKVEAAALRRFREGVEGTMRLGRRAEGHELAKLLNLTEARRREIFPRPRTIVEGRIVVGKRPPSGLPIYDPNGKNVSNAAPAVAVTISRDERRHLIDRLGFQPGTIRKNSLTLAPDEFWRRVAKREAETLPADQLAGRKLPGESDYHASRRIKAETPKTRKRTPGITAARRQYATAHGIGMTKAKEVTKGWSVEAILAQVPTHGVTPPIREKCNAATRYACNARPDKKAPNPAFSHSSLGNQVSGEDDGSDPVSDGVTDLKGHDRHLLAYWYSCTKDRPLTNGTIRIWRYRGSLNAKLFAACEHAVKDTVLPDAMRAHAEKRIAADREKMRSEANASRIKGALRGNLSEIKVA